MLLCTWASSFKVARAGDSLCDVPATQDAAYQVSVLLLQEPHPAQAALRHLEEPGTDLKANEPSRQSRPIPQMCW